MFTRYSIAVAAGTTMTLFVFYVMQVLIALGENPVVDPRDPFDLAFAPTIIEEPTREDPPEFFQEITDPLPPVPPRPSNDFNWGMEVIDVGRRPPTEPTRDKTFGPVISDGPLVAIVRIQPTYPVRAASQNLEGYVIVEFDVLANGTVANVVVLESSHSIFEKAAIEAALRFRYKPRVVAGEPQVSHGIKNRFRFRMERG